MEPQLHVVTGAFSYTGKYITRRLLAAGHRVRTLTGHPDRPNEFGGSVEPVPFNFDHPDDLARSLEGAAVLYNTYWVRFSHGGKTFDQAVANTKVLFEAARKAGVGRVVHVSIANPSEESYLPYYSGKARLERALQETGLAHAILRPTVIFGREDILINNIAWFVRRFPVFGVPGSGKYAIQPIYVEDMADLAVAQGAAAGNAVVDAVGPETYPFDDLVRMIAAAVGRPARIAHFPPGLALFATSIVGRFVGDVILTREEVCGLMDGLLASDQPPTGKTRLSEWVKEHADTLGKDYASEVGRHFESARVQ